MSSGLDLGPILDKAGQVLADAIRTAGTVVDITRPGAGATIDPETTVAVPAEQVLVASGVPAIIVPDAPGGFDRIYPGAREAQDPRFRIILSPEIRDLGRGYLVTVTASRDQRLVGGVFIISTMLDNTAGVGRTALMTRVPIAGQT